MDDNVYTLAFAAAIVFVVWKVIERKYIRKDTLVPKVLVSDGIGVFVAVSAAGYISDYIIQKTSQTVGVFTNEPDF
jgi:hypothetical protein|tara:strand:+ start:116 stop:343 length:228 start_codon:yes stop_codon:yes gene_type:complete